MARFRWSRVDEGPEDPAKRPLAGLVLREHVAALLAHRRDGRDDRRDRALSTAGFDGPQTPPRRLASGPQPLDLGPVMVRSPRVVYADCPLSRAYRLFVTMGLRHRGVARGQPVAGVVTRADLAGCCEAPFFVIGPLAFQARRGARARLGPS